MLKHRLRLYVYAGVRTDPIIGNIISTGSNTGHENSPDHETSQYKYLCDKDEYKLTPITTKQCERKLPFILKFCIKKLFRNFSECRSRNRQNISRQRN